jgi:GT2 family glycosyltransferase/glycosyltransferase involved in cell wall biosynthesis
LNQKQRRGQFSPRDNFGSGGEFRAFSHHRMQVAGGGAAPAAVYEYAQDLVRRVTPGRVVAIARDSDGTFERYFGAVPARVLVQTRGAGCVDTGRAGDLSINPDDAGDVDLMAGGLQDGTPTLFIVPEALNYILDPRPLLRVLRRLLRLNPDNRVIVATAIRDDATSRETDEWGYIRTWSLDEFGPALENAGFCVEWAGSSEIQGRGAMPRIAICQLRSDEALYCEFFRVRGMPAPADHLVIVNRPEQRRMMAGGGSADVIGGSRIQLFPSAHPDPEAMEPTLCEWGLCLADLNGKTSATGVAAVEDEEVLHAVLQALFLYDGIKLIEFQDECGLGVRVVQAKRARLLPADVVLVCIASGAQFVRDHARGDITSHDPGIAARERLSVELADKVLFPNDYLRNIYVREHGLDVRSEIKTAVPLAVRGADVSAEKRPMRTVVFWGLGADRRAYEDFRSAMDILCKQFTNSVGGFRRLVLVGEDGLSAWVPPVAGMEIIRRSFETVSTATFEEFAADALVVAPHLRSPYPSWLHHAIEAACPVIAYASGGAPELLPEKTWCDVLCQPQPSSLAEAIAARLEEPITERIERLVRVRGHLQAARANAFNGYSNALNALKRSPMGGVRQKGGEVSLIIPNFNGSEAYLEGVMAGIHNSSRRPAKIIFVDDGSSESAFAILERSARALKSVATVLVLRHERNRGLSAARNVGLSQVDTAYVCAHDNDNILGHEYLECGCRILDENVSVGAVTAYARTFLDGTDWARNGAGTATYRPLGQDLGIGLRENCFGDAFGIYRTEAVRRIGGWDESSTGLWEDWQLFLKMTVASEPVWVIPREMFFYRVRRDSMARAMPMFEGWTRLARALAPIPTKHAHGIVRGIRNASWSDPRTRAMEEKVRELTASLEELTASQEAMAKMLTASDAILRSRSGTLRHLLRLYRKKARQASWQVKAGGKIPE